MISSYFLFQEDTTLVQPCKYWDCFLHPICTYRWEFRGICYTSTCHRFAAKNVEPKSWNMTVWKNYETGTLVVIYDIIKRFVISSKFGAFCKLDSSRIQYRSLFFIFLSNFYLCEAMDRILKSLVELFHQCFGFVLLLLLLLLLTLF